MDTDEILCYNEKKLIDLTQHKQKQLLLPPLIYEGVPEGNVKNLRDISVGNGLCAVPQYRVPGFLTSSANTDIVDFGPLWTKIHGTAHRPSPTNYL